MDPVIIVQGVAELGPATPEAYIQLPIAEWENLLDIRLRVYGIAAQPSVDNCINPKDINIWFGPENITANYTRWLIDDLNRRDPKSKLAYRGAIKTLHAYLKNSPYISSQVRLIADAEVAEIETTSWAKLFARLGDQTIGPAGAYHPFNFIFGRIPVASFSFREVFESKAESRIPVFQSESTRMLRITATDSLSSVDRNSGPPLDMIRPMKVGYFAELIYKNPFEELVTAEIENLNEILSVTGPIQTALAKQASTLQTLKDELWQTSLRAQGIPTAIERLEKLIKEVRPNLKPKV